MDFFNAYEKFVHVEQSKGGVDYESDVKLFNNEESETKNPDQALIEKIARLEKENEDLKKEIANNDSENSQGDISNSQTDE